jgi:hypothetical protein
MDRKEIKFLFYFLESNRKQLNTMQNAFFTSSWNIYNATGVLTQRQVECLYEIRDIISKPVIKDIAFDTESYRAQYSSFDHLSPYC